MTPTRILKKTRITKQDPRANGAQVAWIFLCDDGKEYTTRELAAVVGFKTAHGLDQRIRNFGFDHPDVLAPPARKGFRVTGIAVNDGRVSRYKSERTDGDAGNFANLSGRVRTENLNKIVQPGTWEATL